MKDIHDAFVAAALHSVLPIGSALQSRTSDEPVTLSLPIGWRDMLVGQADYAPDETGMAIPRDALNLLIIPSPYGHVPVLELAAWAFRDAWNDWRCTWVTADPDAPGRLLLDQDLTALVRRLTPVPA